MSKLKEQFSLKRIACTLAGILLYALSMNLFLAGNNISAGGFSGIALVLNKFIPVGIGALMFCLNLPVLIAAVLVNGWHYAVDAILYSAVYSLSIDLLGFLPTLTDDPLVAAVFGGAAYGLGMALITLGQSSVGGTDLLGRLLLHAFPNMSVGRMCSSLDGLVVVLAMVVFGSVEVGLYAIVTIFICSVVCDRLLSSLERSSVCMIVTGLAAHEVADPMMKKLGLSVTKLEGTGMYTDTQRNVLLSAVRPGEVYRVKRLILELDPQAFVILLTANELIGGRHRAAK